MLTELKTDPINTVKLASAHTSIATIPTNLIDACSINEKKYACEMEVRDNEIDVQGIVNNANYFIYLMHARHKHCKLLGIEFNAVHELGFDMVLVHTDISFKAPLRSGDGFIVTSLLKPNGKIRFDFAQEIIRKADNKTIVIALNTCACLDRATGRPVMPDLLKAIIN